MYIVGIEPTLPKPHYLSNVHLIRVGLPSLLTDLRNHGHQAKLFMEEVRSIDMDDLKEEVKRADLVAISTISAAHGRGDYFAQWVHEQTGKPVVMGGPHVTFCQPEESLRHADYVIRHEGEFALPLLIEALEGKKGLEDVPNLSYRNKEGKIIQNPISPNFPNLDDFPFTDFSLISGWKNSYMLPIESARGCPYRCTFCCVHKMFPKIRFRSPESVVEEIKRINPKSVFFSDDNFAIDMERSKDILSLMLKKLDRIPYWGAQVRINVGKDKEWLRLAKRTNCQFLCIGFESVNPGSLEEMQKKQDIEEIQECLATFKEMKMLKEVHASYAVGFDSDDRETARRTADEARKNGIKSIQIWVLSPLPGTEFRARLEKEDRLLSYDPRDCDGARAIFKPAQMTAEELQTSVFAGMERFYSWQNRTKALFKGMYGITRDYAIRMADTRDLWRENFRETVVKWYGRRIVKKIKAGAKQHLPNIRRK